MLTTVQIKFSHFFPVMVIGFSQRVRTVCECDALEGNDLIPIDIDVATERLAEREHPMVFRLQSGSTAIVEPLNNVQNLLYDALFGIIVEHGDPIQEEFDLASLETIIQSRSVEIRDDLRPEGEECFTIRIFPVDVPGRHELFDCNEDEDGETNYFCEATICIADDDGRFSSKFLPSELLIKIFQTNLGLHLWKKPSQLMRVWVQ